MTPPVIITVNGTGDPDPNDIVGFAGMLGAMVGSVNPWEVVANMKAGIAPPSAPYRWQPIGYPAAVTNMRDSYNNAVAQIVAALGGPPCADYQAPVYPTGNFVLSGYSQGSCATDIVWQQFIYPADGILHHRINDCQSICNFGDVFRTENIASGNSWQGIPVPGSEDGSPTGGIGQATNNLTVAESTYVNPTNPLGQPTIMSWDLPGDLYGASPQGSAGAVGESIMNIIFDTDFINVVKVLEDLAEPIGMFEEIANAIGFFAAGTDAPHWQYANQGCVTAAAAYLTELAAALD